jgi:hypothetical protein
MFWPSATSDTASAGESCLKCADGRCTGLEAFWKEYSSLAGRETRGYVVKDVTSLAESAWSENGVDVRVDMSAAVTPGTTPRKCVGWLAVFLVGVSKEAHDGVTIPEGDVQQLPLLFGECSHGKAFRFPRLLCEPGLREVFAERTVVNQAEAKSWSLCGALTFDETELKKYWWIACAVYCLDDCMGASIGMDVKIGGRSG